MRMVFLCGHCRGKLAADSSHAGSPVKCPRCQAVVEAPATDDPGYEFVDEPEPEPPPPRRDPDPDPAPRRKSSRRLLRDDRPIRRRSGEPGNGSKAALLALLGLAIVGVVVVVALFAFSGGKIEPRKGGLPDLLGGAGPPLQPDWEWHRGPGYDVLVPRRGVKEDGLAVVGVPAHLAAGAEVTVVRSDGFDVIAARQPAPWNQYQVPPGESAALLARMIERMGGRDVRVLELNRYPARDFSASQGGKETHYRLAVAGDAIVLITVAGVGLRATDERVRIARESLTLR